MIKIDETGKIRPPSEVKTTKKSQGSTQFQNLMNTQQTGQQKATQAIATNTPINSLNSLLALQELNDSLERKKKAIKWGHSLIEQLQDLQLSLLEGCLSLDQLNRLSQSLKHLPIPQESQLQNLLDDISLRVEIELAKLARNAKDY